MKQKRTWIRKMTGTVACLLAAMMILAGGFPQAASAAAGGTPVYSSADLFTDRDLAQEADLSEAAYISVSDGQEVRITEAGVYVLSGTAADATVYVEAPDDAKVQMVLQNLQVTNSDFPVINVVSADKVFITTVADSALAVTGTFRADGGTSTDGVIFSKQDLTLNGTAMLTIASTENGVVCKDDLKISGGTYAITAKSKAFEANDSIRVAGGIFTLRAGTDGFHAENSDDDKDTSGSAAVAWTSPAGTTASTPPPWCRLTTAISPSARPKASKEPSSSSTAARSASPRRTTASTPRINPLRWKWRSSSTAQR